MQRGPGVDNVETVDNISADLQRGRKSPINTEKKEVGKNGRKTKYPHVFYRRKAVKKCGYVERSYSEKIFADFMDISGPHSYQQITGCAIFQKKIFNLVKS